MATESKTAIPDFVEQARAMLVINPLIAPQMEQFWKAQDQILEESEAFSRAWFERRHEATKTALEAVDKMEGTGADPAAAMRSMADWQQASVQRLAADLQQWVELCARCTRRMTDAEVEATEEGVEEVGKRAKSATRTKHATPV